MRAVRDVVASSQRGSLTRVQGEDPLAVGLLLRQVGGHRRGQSAALRVHRRDQRVVIHPLFPRNDVVTHRNKHLQRVRATLLVVFNLGVGVK